MERDWKQGVLRRANGKNWHTDVGTLLDMVSTGNATLGGRDENGQPLFIETAVDGRQYRSTPSGGRQGDAVMQLTYPPPSALEIASLELLEAEVMQLVER